MLTTVVNLPSSTMKMKWIDSLRSGLHPPPLLTVWKAWNHIRTELRRIAQVGIIYRRCGYFHIYIYIASVSHLESQTGLFSVPDSPSYNRRSIAKGKARARSPSPERPARLPLQTLRSVTPPARPCTPPRKRLSSASKGLQLSAKETPISHRGLHMSPSPSLAYYKSHLDPPPAAVFHSQAPLLTALTAGEDLGLTLPSPDLSRTPSRKRTTQPGSSGRRLPEISPFRPITPKHLVFPSQEFSFRTPSRYFDPHDPSNLLDDELQRIGEQLQFDESPSGLFGKHSSFFDLSSPSRSW
jgi:hypothetical protein